MSHEIGNGLKLSWEDFKTYISQYGSWGACGVQESSSESVIWYSDKGVILYSVLPHHLPSYTDFNTNYKSLIKSVQFDDDGSMIVRAKIAVKGRSMYYAGPKFQPGYTDSLVWETIDPVTLTTTSRTWATIQIYDASGNVATDYTTATKTVIDIDIPFNYELAGGVLTMPSVLPVGNGTKSDWRVWVIAAPEIPKVAGGQITLVDGLFLKFYEAEEIIIDGRAPKQMVYQLVPEALWGGTGGNSYSTNKMRFIFAHPTGIARTDFQILLDTFISGV